MSSDKKYIAYTDGSCLGNPGPGGWGIVYFDIKGKEHHLYGSDPYTTNNKMEITAIIEAIREIPDPLVIRTDSQLTINHAIGKFKRNENLDLWDEFNEISKGRNIVFEKVRAHSGNKYNDIADSLAKRGSTEAKNNA